MSSYDIDEPDEPQSFIPEARAEDEATFVPSGNRFSTYDEALMYLMSLVLQYPWMRTRVTPSTDLPNCEWINNRIKPLKPGDVA
jgi:hypothetical protein